MLTKLFLCTVCLLSLAFAKDVLKNDTPTSVTIHATNETSVPSIHYIVDAVECLKEAYSVYTEGSDRVKLYGELFQEKHNETEWSVVAGYNALYIKSQWYVEVSVEGGGKNKDKKKDDNQDSKILYLIFSKN